MSEQSDAQGAQQSATAQAGGRQAGASQGMVASSGHKQTVNLPQSKTHIYTFKTEEKEEKIQATELDLTHGKIFEYKSDFDTNGIIRYLGTNKGRNMGKSSR
eukprot:11197_1